MANVLSLAMKVSADASSVPRQLTPVERALAGLSKEAEKATSVMDKFAASSSAAAAAQARSAADFEKLAAALESRSITPEEYARQFAALTAAANDTAAAFAEGARITEQARTADERRAAELERLTQLLRLGAISEQTFARASASASGSERDRADAAADAARIIRANLTPQERYDQQIQDLTAHLQAGRLSQEQFNRAAERARRDLNAVGKEAGRTDKNVSDLNRSVSLLARIEVGRLAVDGIQALSRAFSSVTNQISSVVRSVNSSIDTLNDFSARTGLSVESLQGYSLAAKLAGVDTEQFGAAVQKLAVNIGKATPGDALDKSLRQINLSVAQLRQLAPEQQFSQIGQAISQLPTAADRAAAAVALFGKQGAALAPLFREGADSLEQLKAEAERLGIIVSQAQVNNVADMNDGFDKVRATIEGIIGQVIGNLAPAVTAVTDEFLKFVAEWSGTQGTGGTGIANAITDVLLKGADYFAGIFDAFIESFTGFDVSLQNTALVFDIVSKGLFALSETFRAVFNVFELAGNAIAIALGKVLEGLGSYVSSDLEQIGKDMQTLAIEAGQRNSEQLTDAAKNAANAVVGVFTGDTGTSESAGEGEAQRFLRGLRSGIEQARLPEVKVQTNLEQTQKDLEAFLQSATGETSKFFQESVGTLETFQGMAEAGKLSASQIQIMNGFMADLNAKLTQEKQLRQEAQQAAEAQLEADRKRIEQLTQPNDATAKLEQDLLAVEREQARVSEQLAASRQANDAEAANALVSQQARLDQLAAKLEEEQQAIEQGFVGGFARAFEQINTDVNRFADEAAQFGEAGALAFQTLQQGIAAAQQQARDGILNQEALSQQVEQQKQLFQQELKNIDEAEKARTKAREDGEKARQELERQQAKEAEDRAKAAADAQQKQAQDLAAARQAQEQAILEEQRRFAEERRKSEEAEFARQQERLRQLNTLGEGVVNTADVRTQEGAAIVLGLAANAQDPRLIEARLTNKLMRQQVTALLQNLNRIGIPVSF